MSKPVFYPNTKFMFGKLHFHKLFLIFLLMAGLGACSNPEVQNLNMEESVLVDVRTPEEFSSGSIQNAINIPVDELSSRLGELDSSKKLVVFCRSGNRSSRAKSILEEAGFKNVINGGGVNDLKEQLEMKKEQK